MAANSAKPQMKIAQQVGYCDSWWPGAESTRSDKFLGISLASRAYGLPSTIRTCDLGLISKVASRVRFI
jgi:hypothetical protein